MPSVRRPFQSLFALLFALPLLGAEVPDDIRAKFSTAAQLLAENRHAEALPLLREVAAQVPEGSGVWGNLGLAAAATGDHKLALEARLRYRQLQPDDLQGLSRVMQTYQALGMLNERDAQREELVAKWRALPAAGQQKETGFVRDQFDAGGLRFIVVEYYEPAPPVRRLYRFEAVNAERKPVHFFGLESGDSTTEVARQMGTIGKEQRIYSLDKYETTPQTLNHWTFGLMDSLPGYDAVRAMVVDAAEGRLQATSSSSRPR